MVAQWLLWNHFKGISLFGDGSDLQEGLFADATVCSRGFAHCGSADHSYSPRGSMGDATPQSP